MSPQLTVGTIAWRPKRGGLNRGLAVAIAVVVVAGSVAALLFRDGGDEAPSALLEETPTSTVASGPTFGSSPSRFWDVVVDGERVKLELYLIEGTDRVRLSILYFE